MVNKLYYKYNSKYRDTKIGETSENLGLHIDFAFTIIIRYFLF